MTNNLPLISNEEVLMVYMQSLLILISLLFYSCSKSDHNEVTGAHSQSDALTNNAVGRFDDTGSFATFSLFTELPEMCDFIPENTIIKSTLSCRDLNSNHETSDCSSLIGEVVFNFASGTAIADGDECQLGITASLPSQLMLSEKVLNFEKGKLYTSNMDSVKKGSLSLVLSKAYSETTMDKNLSALAIEIKSSFEEYLDSGLTPIEAAKKLKEEMGLELSKDHFKIMIGVLIDRQYGIEQLANFSQEILNKILDLPLNELILSLHDSLVESNEKIKTLAEIIVKTGLVNNQSIKEIFRTFSVDLQYSSEEMSIAVKTTEEAATGLALRDILAAIGEAFDDKDNKANIVNQVIINAELLKAENLKEIFSSLMIDQGYTIEQLANMLKAIDPSLNLSIRNIVTALGASVNNIGDLTLALSHAGLMTGGNLVAIFSSLSKDLLFDIRDILSTVVSAGLDLTAREIILALIEATNDVINVGKTSLEQGLITAVQFFELAQGISETAKEAACQIQGLRFLPKCVF